MSIGSAGFGAISIVGAAAPNQPSLSRAGRVKQKHPTNHISDVPSCRFPSPPTSPSQLQALFLPSCMFLTSIHPHPTIQIWSSHRPSNGAPPSPIPPVHSMHPLQIASRYITWNRPLRGREQTSPCCLCIPTRFVSRRRDYN
jgi:hypothetical protein